MPRLIVLALCVAGACSKRTADERDRDRDPPAPQLRVVFGPCVGLSGSPVFTSAWRERSTDDPPPPRRFGAHDSNIASPLRAIESELRACATAGRLAYGIGLVDLGEFPRLSGLSPDNARSCFVTAIQAVHAEPERCGFAFGVMPLGEGHVVEIRADAIVADNATVADPRAIIADTEPARLDRLRAALARVRDIDASDALRVRMPTSLRPADTTRMKVVNAVVAVMRATNVEPLFTAQDGVGWRPLRAVELPAAPLPSGFGPPRLVPPKDMRMFTLRVGADSLTIRDTSQESVTIPQLADVGHDWDRALAELRRFHETLGNRDDIEIAGEDDVEYVEVTRAIEVATSAGFAEWRLVDPR